MLGSAGHRSKWAIATNTILLQEAVEWATKKIGNGRIFWRRINVQQLTCKMVWSFLFCLFRKGLNFKRNPGGKSVKKCGKVRKKCVKVPKRFALYSCCPFVFLWILHSLYRKYVLVEIILLYITSSWPEPWSCSSFCLHHITLKIPEANWFCDALHHGYIKNCFENLKCNTFRSTGTASRVLFWRRELIEPHWVLGQPRWVLLKNSVSSLCHTNIKRLRGTHWALSPELGEGKKTHWARCLKPYSPKLFGPSPRKVWLWLCLGFRLCAWLMAIRASLFWRHRPHFRERISWFLSSTACGNLLSTTLMQECAHWQESIMTIILWELHVVILDGFCNLELPRQEGHFGHVRNVI